MLTRLLIFLCGISPFLRKTLWRWWYGKLAKQIAVSSWTFMNYGYAPTSRIAEETLKLQPQDEPDRLCIQLYQQIVSPVSLEGKRVLEVGCGRGGGASFLARYHRPANITGMDFSSEAIGFCRQRHGTIGNLEFSVGDAEKIPFPDASFDAVVNVESSHCYGNVAKFFSEVLRVLRPGGYFLFADLRVSAEMKELQELLAAKPQWQLVEQEDITERVAAALSADDARKRKMISELVPGKLQPIFEEFAGVSGGKVFNSLQKRELLYFRFSFRRNQAGV
jgi:ubiquinone/menaquinone biosynthesis C-methylase UbiE